MSNCGRKGNEPGEGSDGAGRTQTQGQRAARPDWQEPRGEQRWDLRVTEFFRRANGVWQRLHRHADPLVDRHSLQEMAALLATAAT